MGGIHEVEEKAAKLAKEVAARKEDAKKVRGSLYVRCSCLRGFAVIALSTSVC